MKISNGGGWGGWRQPMPNRHYHGLRQRRKKKALTQRIAGGKIQRKTREQSAVKTVDNQQESQQSAVLRETAEKSRRKILKGRQEKRKAQ